MKPAKQPEVPVVAEKPEPQATEIDQKKDTRPVEPEETEVKIEVPVGGKKKAASKKAVKKELKAVEPVKPLSPSSDPLTRSDGVLSPIDVPLIHESESVPLVSSQDKPVGSKRKPAAAKGEQPPSKRAKKTKADKKVVDGDQTTVHPTKPVKPEVSRLPVDPREAGIAEDEEDMYLLRLIAQAHESKQDPLDYVASLEHVDAPAAIEADDEDYVHPSGCARSHGYYKVSGIAKSAYLPQRNRAIVEVESNATGSTTSGTTTHHAAVASSRSARVATRRFVQGMEQSKKAADADSDLFAFNQLRTRKKQLKFSRSPIHDWGLYAAESITPGEMVIEYVGEVIRAQVADVREKWYEKIGIGSSYLFRVDDDAVVDATKKGSMARLINHCCTPNCTAKIITINGEKKVS